MAIGNFELDLRRFGKLTADRASTVLRKTALDLLGSVVAGIPKGVGTPVDTGRARGGWQVELNAFPSGTDTPLDKGGSATIDRGRETIAQAALTDAIYIGNNVEYIMPLEFGHSQQAPAGMLRVALRAFQGIIEVNAREAAD